MKKLLAALALSVTLTLPALAVSPAPEQADKAMVVTSQHLATQVGVDILKAGGNAIDGGYDGLLQVAHVLDDVAGHTGEFVKLVTSHLEQRADDVVDATARAKTFSGSGEYDDFDGFGRRQIRKNLLQIAVGLEGQRVEFFGIV